MNLIDVTKQFATDEQCLAYLESMRWPDGVRCPVCGNSHISKCLKLMVEGVAASYTGTGKMFLVICSRCAPRATRTLTPTASRARLS